MFERRLNILLAGAAVATTALAGRLFQLQILEGAYYEELARAALESPPEVLQPIRGRILDRNGRVLAADEPTWDVTVHYGVLSMDRRYLSRLESALRRSGERTGLPASEAADHARARVRERIAESWLELARAAGVPTGDLRRRRDEIFRRVEALRAYLWEQRRARGYEESLDELRLAEDEMRHPILRDVSPELRARVELTLADAPWIRIESSVRRSVHDATAVCHLLGRLGQVSREQMDADPNREDALRRYLPGEKTGISGVERLADADLRGVRGLHQLNLDRQTLAYVAPIDGRDLLLSIDLELQQRIVAILADAVAAHPPATGAACVVIDIPTREVLALASYPVFDPEHYNDRYRALRDDTRNRPLLFRAVAADYPPGSLVKPLTMLAGLAGRVVDPREAIDCQGRLLPNVDGWHCWTHWRHLAPHGPLAAVEALKHSCNVYFYTVGQRLGAERLTHFFRHVLLAEDADASWRGTRLIEEHHPHIPTSEWMRQRRGRPFQTGDSRNYALGQGEILLTPLAVANLFATLASGVIREPTLLHDDPAPRPARPVRGARSADWSLIRDGLYRCVNEPGGTAYNGARMDDLIICGKTGSAQNVARVTEWRFTFAGDGGTTRSIVAPTLEAARERLGLGPAARPIAREIAGRWPPNEEGKTEPPTHAWFAGFAPREEPRVALAVIIEYGGSGGRVAAPVGRQVFEALLESSPEYLRRDGGYDGRRTRPSSPPPDQWDVE